MIFVVSIITTKCRLNKISMNLSLQIRQLPESVIVETTEYKCLQSQFSVLYNESMQLKTQLDDARQQLQSSKNIHLRHIEMMEVSPSYIKGDSP